MNKFFILVILCLVICSSAPAQSLFPELDKIKEIKLLESTNKDVERIFADYPFSSSADIPAENSFISIDYSSGNCSNSNEDWNIPKDFVTGVYIDFRVPVKPQNLGIDLSKFIKERHFANLADDFVYHNKAEGIAYDVYKDEISRIIFTPSKSNYSLLCNNKRVRQYYSSKSWFSDKLKERRFKPDYYRGLANVASLTLSVNEITADWARDNLAKDEYKTIIVETKGSSSDPTDILTYEYKVSGGRIVGNGANVIWDLKGVKPGVYIIAAGINNGCGICGRTMTKAVVVKPPDCSPE